jgi:hypothetical protein
MTTWKKIPSYGKLFSFVRNEILRCWIFAWLSPFNTTACYKCIGGASCLYFQGKFSAITYLKSYPDNELSRNTNKMQFCNRIYYSNVFWRLRMFRAANRSSSGALNCIRSLWFICPCGDWPLPRLSGKWINFPLSLGNGRLPYGHINQRLQIQFRAPDDERCAARNMLSLQ